jgi:hypothetical protein
MTRRQLAEAARCAFRDAVRADAEGRTRRARNLRAAGCGFNRAAARLADGDRVAARECWELAGQLVTGTAAVFSAAG